MTAKVAKCKACKQEILWAKTENDKNIPLNPEPDPTGNLWIVGRNEDGAPVVHVKKQNEAAPAAADVYKAHMATCTG